MVSLLLSFYMRQTSNAPYRRTSISNRMKTFLFIQDSRMKRKILQEKNEMRCQNAYEKCIT